MPRDALVGRAVVAEPAPLQATHQIPHVQVDGKPAMAEHLSVPKNRPRRAPQLEPGAHLREQRLQPRAIRRLGQLPQPAEQALRPPLAQKHAPAALEPDRVRLEQRLVAVGGPLADDRQLGGSTAGPRRA